MNVAVVGSRNFKNQSKVLAVVSSMPRDWVIISGGAPGVDTWAERAALGSGHTVRIYKADWKTYGKSAGFKRNTTMVEEADFVVAFWDGESKGTKDTIDKALKAHKELQVTFA